MSDTANISEEDGKSRLLWLLRGLTVNQLDFNPSGWTDNDVASLRQVARFVERKMAEADAVKEIERRKAAGKWKCETWVKGDKAS